MYFNDQFNIDFRLIYRSRSLNSGVIEFQTRISQPTKNVSQCISKDKSGQRKYYTSANLPNTFYIYISRYLLRLVINLDIYQTSE